MTLEQIKDCLDAEIYTCEHKLYREILTACGSDLMSDVLAYSKEKAILLTGLINQQAVRTAEMMDFKAIIFVRGKKPTKEIIELAEQKEIVILSTKNSLFVSSGILYSKGLRGDIHSYEV